jgi:hypothetical protein
MILSKSNAKSIFNSARKGVKKQNSRKPLSYRATDDSRAAGAFLSKLKIAQNTPKTLKTHAIARKKSLKINPKYESV